MYGALDTLPQPINHGVVGCITALGGQGGGGKRVGSAEQSRTAGDSGLAELETTMTTTIETAARMTMRLGASEAESKARFFATWYARGNSRRSFWLGVAESIADASH